MEPGEESPVPLFGLQPVIARDRVRYVGEPVAIVVATDPKKMFATIRVDTSADPSPLMPDDLC